MEPETGSFAISELLGFPAPPLIEAALSRVTGMHAIAALYDKVRGCMLPQSIVRELSVCVQARNSERVPEAGPAVVVANHPFGLLDGAIVASLCLERRNDVRILANRILSGIPELADLIIPVDVSGDEGGRRNAAAVRKAIAHVSSGGLLVVFPAGEVSQPSGDRPWSQLVGRLIGNISEARADVKVLPVYIHGSNSRIFHAAGILHERLRTALLPRELLNKRGRTVEVSIGVPVPGVRIAGMRSHEQGIEYLRWRTDLLGRKSSLKPRTRIPVFDRTEPTLPRMTVCEAVPAEDLAHDVELLPERCRLGNTADLHVYLAEAQQIPSVLREIGRLREITFRAAGEGSGKSADLDEFDEYYLHLFVWRPERREVVGAYRIGQAQAIRRRLGTKGLYTASLFRFGDEFLHQLGPALELGRSFVRPEYQRTFAPLLLLWKGVGHYVATHPNYKVLFGPVSISNSYSATSRELMVAWLEQRNPVRELAAFVRARNPFRRQPSPVPATVEIEDLSDVISDIENGGAGVPVLLRQYLKLGGKLVGFNVDRVFSDALDGLIVVDLTKTEPRLLERYLGRTEAKTFLSFHRGEHGANKDYCHSELDAADHSRCDPAADTLFQVHWRPRVGLHLLDAWRRAVGQNR